MGEGDTLEIQQLIDGMKRVDYILHHRLWSSLQLGERPGTFMFMAKLAKAAKQSPDGGVRVSSLASICNITSSGITQMVTSLEDRGLVSRRMDPEDRRAVLVFLTEEGQGRVDSLMDSVNQAFHGLVDYLGREKSRAFLDLLNDVASYLDGLGAHEARQGDEE